MTRNLGRLAATIFLLFLVLSPKYIFGQTKIQDYKPLPGVNIDQVFPIAAVNLVSSKIGIEKMDWNKRTMQSTFVQYTKNLILPARSKFLLSIDDNNTLSITMVDPETYDSQTNSWSSSFEAKKERTLKSELMNYIIQMLNNPEQVKKCQEWFFKDMYINSRFFEFATELAGERWFESYLKDRAVSWRMTFNDIKTNTANNYKYQEIYSAKVNTLTTDRINFFVTKFTNADKNTLTSKNTLADLQGYCRSLLFKENSFFIVLTDNLESPLPTNSVQEKEADSKKSVLEFAEKLKELKSLLDQGIITKEEYEIEKKKVLNSKN